MLSQNVQLPLPLLLALIALALPVAFLICLAVNDWGRARNLRLIGRSDDFRDDGTYTVHWCLLYVPVWRETGCHSTWLA